jgi:hypothetical protein
MQISRFSIGVLGMLLCVFTNGVRGMDKPDDVKVPVVNQFLAELLAKYDNTVNNINQRLNEHDTDISELKKNLKETQGGKKKGEGKNTEDTKDGSGEEDPCGGCARTEFMQQTWKKQAGVLGGLVGASALIEYYAEKNKRPDIQAKAQYAKRIGMQGGVVMFAKALRDEGHVNSSAFGDLGVNIAANVVVNAVLDHTKVGREISSTCKKYAPNIAGSETVAKGAAGYGAYHYIAKPVAKAVLEYGKKGIMDDVTRIAKNATTEKDGKTWGALGLVIVAGGAHFVAKRYAKDNKVVQAFTSGFAAGSMVKGGHTMWISNREVGVDNNENSTTGSSTITNKVINAVAIPAVTGGVRASWEYLKQKNLLPNVVKNTVEGIADNIPVPEELQEAVLPALISFAWVYGAPYLFKTA